MTILAMVDSISAFLSRACLRGPPVAGNRDFILGGLQQLVEE